MVVSWKIKMNIGKTLGHQQTEMGKNVGNKKPEKNGTSPRILAFPKNWLMDFCGKRIYGSGKTANRHDLEMVEVPLWTTAVTVWSLWPDITGWTSFNQVIIIDIESWMQEWFHPRAITVESWSVGIWWKNLAIKAGNSKNIVTLCRWWQIVWGYWNWRKHASLTNKHEWTWFGDYRYAVCNQ